MMSTTPIILVNIESFFIFVFSVLSMSFFISLLYASITRDLVEGIVDCALGKQANHKMSLKDRASVRKYFRRNGQKVKIF